jgi:3-deoxy-D-manno-octulosonic-acid transferase
MRLIYTLSVYVYAFIIRWAAFFNPKAREWWFGRKASKWHYPQIPKNAYWFHCASLGEFDQGLPLMHELKKRFPENAILVTFFSPSGKLNYHKRKGHPVDFATYLPIDSLSEMTKFVSTIQPKCCFLVKYEFWPNLLVVCQREGVYVFSLSTLLRPQHFYFSWYGFWFLNHLKLVKYFFAQNQETAELLREKGIQQVQVTGDLRFDNVVAQKNRQSMESNEILEHFLNGQRAIVFGSSWPQEEDILFQSLGQLPGKKIILAPHQVDERNVVRLMHLFGSEAVRYSGYHKDSLDKQILILDTIGLLSFAYKYGYLAFVGGGFRGQLHNILEPAVYGLPVLFGPNHQKFPEARIFINEGIGFETKSSFDFIRHEEKLSCQTELTTRVSSYVERQTGATKQVYDLISEIDW